MKRCGRRIRLGDGSYGDRCGALGIAYPILEMRKTAAGGSFEIHVPMPLCQTHVDETTVGLVMDNSVYLQICRVMEGHGYEAPARDLTTIKFVPLSEMPMVIGGERELDVPVKRLRS